MEFLAGCHRNGVLKLCASHLDDVLELLALVLERVDEVLEAFLKLPVHSDESVTKSRRISVVGGLRAVHMIVRGAELVLALVVSHDLKGSVGDDLVRVHIH